jgi:hypothetical protein
MKKILISEDAFGDLNAGFLTAFTSDLNQFTFRVN